MATRLGLDTGQFALAISGATIGLGLAALVLAVGVGARIPRLGLCAALLLFAASPALLAAADSGVGLFLAECVLGVANAPVDYAQTVFGVALSVSLGRTLLPRLELVFTGAGLIGAYVAGLTAGRFGVDAYLLGLALACVCVGSVALPFVPPLSGGRGPDGPRSAVDPPNRTMWLVALLCFLALFAESAPVDWASLYYRELGAPDERTAVGAAAYQTGFALALLVGGRLADRWGAPLVTRVSSVLFGCSMVCVVAAPSPVIATAALFAAGLGSANLLPLALSALGRHSDFRRWVARVTPIMYAGAAASKLLGIVGEESSLRVALALTVPAVVGCFVLAGVTASRSAAGEG